MKRINLIIVSVLLLFGKVNAQKFQISAMTEKSVSGWQGGSALSYQTKNLWSFGVFYQQDLSISSDENIPSNLFYGIVVNTPLLRSDKINFYFNSRAGLINKDFFVFTPGLETELRLTNRFSVSTSMSMRMSYPAASVKLNVKL